MNKVDWSKAPEGAEFYGQGLFWRIINKMHCYYDKASDGWLLPEHWHHPTKCGDYEQKPAHTASTSDALDWSGAPLGAQYYANKAWWKADDVGCGWLVFVNGIWLCAESTVTFAHSPIFYDDVISRADHIVDANEKAWPESEERVNIIGQNGNDGLVYQDVEKCFDEQLSKQPSELVGLSAASILQEGLAILSGRGKQYGSEGEERSFPQVAQAFTALTGKRLVGSDVCLILALVKQVRQYAQPRYHHDSAVDAVNYFALQAEERQKEIANGL